MKKIIAMAAIAASLSGCATVSPDTSHTKFISVTGQVMRVGTAKDIKTVVTNFKRVCHKSPQPFGQVVRVSNLKIYHFVSHWVIAWVPVGMNLKAGDEVYAQGGNKCDSYPRVTKIISRGDGSASFLKTLY
ncbi:MAG: hypothetical protein KGI54_15815 [Pseudomonadota bacterium]|nr:hypothetical protein [Pseudomonadota bacterium]